MASTNVTLVPRRKRQAEMVRGGFCPNDFRPNDKQRRFVQLALASGGPLQIGRICKQVGISRTTYYRWREQPGFAAWMSAQWVSALLADGGRLLSIGRAFAAGDFRYWRAMAELVFDPRGLGLLTAWQQRMAEAGAAVAPLFDDDDPELDDDLDALESAWAMPAPSEMTDEAEESGEEADEAEDDDAPEAEMEPEQGSLVPPVVTPSDAVESTTYTQKMEHFAKPRRARRAAASVAPAAGTGSGFHEADVPRGEPEW